MECEVGVMVQRCNMCRHYDRHMCLEKKQKLNDFQRDRKNTCIMFERKPLVDIMYRRQFEKQLEVCCGTCRYCIKKQHWICSNEDSVGYGEETRYTDSCEEWEER